MAEEIVLGRNVRAYIGSTAFAHATSCSIAINVEFIELAPTSLTDAEWRRAKPRSRSATVTVNALHVVDGAQEQFDTIYDDLDGESSITLKIEGPAFSYSGTAYVQSLTLNAAAGQDATYSATFLISGEISKSAVT